VSRRGHGPGAEVLSWNHNSDNGGDPLSTRVRTVRRLWLRWRAVPWALRGLTVAVLILVLVTGIPFGWTRAVAGGHLYDEVDVAGNADVVLVLGAEVDPSGDRPMPFLQGRLDTAAQLLRDGRARVILVSGDASGGSGNETSVMASYLAEVGVNSARVVIDPYGLDTYDSCLRARQVYGVTRAFVVTQPYHLARAVTLCRHVGIDADGVGARCDGCVSLNLARNWLRDYFACSKAAWDAFRDRPPGIESPPSNAVAEALATTGAKLRD
jgi:vancomycin permeability regulator SanA